VIDISKQFLIQDSAGAEAMLQRDIVAALSEQLEKTLLGDAAGTATQPAGIGNLITATAITDWQDTVALETALKTANYNGNYTYLLNPYVNGALTVLPKDAGSGIMAITDNKLNGNTVEVTNSVFTKGGIIGDWRQYMVFLWSGIDLTVDTISLAYCGKVRITANMYVNGGPRDLNAFKTFNMA
jgi:HK97 family phage major capsid protein